MEYKIREKLFGANKASAIGTSLTLNDTVKYPINKLTIDGVCEQTTTKGNQLSHGTLTLVPLKNVVLSDDCIFTFNADTNAPYELNFSERKLSEVLVLPSDVSTIYITCRLLSGTCTANYQLRIKGADGSNKGNYSLNGSVASVNVSDIDINYDRLQVYFYGTDKTISNNAKFQIIISKDSNCELEPYTGGQPSPSPNFPQEIKTITDSLKITSCNKNLYFTDKEVYSYTTTNSSWKFLNGNSGADSSESNKTIYKAKVEKGKTYTFSANITSSANIISTLMYDTNIQIARIDGTNINYNNTFTSNIDGYALLRNYINSGSSVEISNVMLVEGQATEYEPYQGSSLNITIPSNEFVGKLDDTYKDTLNVVYKDDGHYHLILNKMIGKVVCDGSENWFLSGSTTNKILVAAFNTNGLVDGQGISNYFKYSLYVKKNKFGIYNNGKNLRFCLDIQQYATIDDFKSWLSTHNTEVYYALKTPYELDLGIVDTLLSYDEVTNIFTDSDLYPVINVKYYNGSLDISNYEFSIKEV